MLRFKKTYTLLKDRSQHLDDFKNIKENDWWRLSKFPVLFCIITLIHIFSPDDALYRHTLAAFLFYSWVDLSLHMSLIGKKVQILYAIECSRSVYDGADNNNPNQQNKS